VTAVTIVLAAGGTGGHLFPAEALAATLLERGHAVTVLTDTRGAVMGETVRGLGVHIIAARTIVGGVLAKIKGFAGLALAYVQAHRALARLRPAAVVGFGGYPSLPTVLAAKHRRIPVLLHEQNAVLGRANRAMARGVSGIAVCYAAVSRLPAGVPTVMTGNPVRPAFADKRAVLYRAPSDDAPVRVLVTGGSQGARVFSDVVPEAVALLPQALRARLHITQQCRPEDLDRVQARYAELGISAELARFFTDIPDRLAACHLILCRSGASTLAEVTVVGRPALLVPYAFAMDDHQTANARALVDAGAAWLLPQADATAQSLSALLLTILSAPADMARAAAAAQACGVVDASTRLADAVLALSATVQPETAH
jgi:UDP-N-acetylglucosamine--N-acetylmuramyl-(pentapeptide) pyrophosphoryl-undecaprenol N-acetylglucosamine transferase